LVINVEINQWYVVDEMLQQLQLLLQQHCLLIDLDLMMLMIELDNHLMMYHHHLKDLLMVNLVHVLLNDVQDLFVEQNVDHINDMEIFFLDYEYFEYDVED